MATFALSLLLVPYAIVVVIFLVFALLNVYHLVHYGATTRVSFVFTFVFLAGSVIILAASWWYLRDAEWSSQIVLSLFNGAPPATGPADLAPHLAP